MTLFSRLEPPSKTAKAQPSNSRTNRDDFGHPPSFQNFRSSNLHKSNPTSSLPPLSQRLELKAWIQSNNTELTSNPRPSLSTAFKMFVNSCPPKCKRSRARPTEHAASPTCRIHTSCPRPLLTDFDSGAQALDSTQALGWLPPTSFSFKAADDWIFGQQTFIY